jgi:hypothetical protein
MGAGSEWEREAPRRWLRPRHPHGPYRPLVRGGGRTRPRTSHARRRSPSRPRTGHHEHPLGPRPSPRTSRGRHRDRTEWLPRPVLPLDGTKPVSPKPCTTCWRQAAPCPDRPHRRGTTRTTEPWATADPAPRDQGAGEEGSRINPARRPGHRAGSNPPLRRRPCSHPVRYATGRSSPRHPRPVAGQRKRVVRLLLLSSSAPHLFGDRVEDFASEARELLTSRSPEGIFWDWPGDTEVILARKPG